MSQASLEWLERQRQAGARWKCGCGCDKTLPMADPADVPWCAEHGLLDWRSFGYRLVLPDGTEAAEPQSDAQRGAA